MKLFELPHFAERAPAKIAAPRLPQIPVGDRIEAAPRVEPRGHLMGQALVLHEAVLMRRPDRLFIESLGIELPPFQARNLGGD